MYSFIFLSHFSISEDIENAWVVICFITPAYESSDDCRKQLRFAESHKKKIVPIILTSNWSPSGWLDFTITDIQRLNWDTIRSDDVSEKMPELLLRLRTLFTGKKPDPSSIRAVRRPAGKPGSKS